MKIEINLATEQFQKLIDSLGIYEGQIKHLKGRVRNLEAIQRELVKNQANLK